MAVTLQPANRGDTTSIAKTVEQVDENLVGVMADETACQRLNESVLSEVVADKGYHSNMVLKEQRESDIRSYISEPDRGRRNWLGKPAERDAVYANRRRIRGRRGQRLCAERAELPERSFAHCYETGGMRRTHLRGHPNILKRLLIHVAGFNLGLVMRRKVGFGTSRGLQGLSAGVCRVLTAFKPAMRVLCAMAKAVACSPVSRNPPPRLAA